MVKLGLASNFQDEIENIDSIWDIFKDLVSLWTVVDSGSTDGTQQSLRELAGDRLNLIESDMIRTNGYGYSRTKLIELSEGMDWVLIIDGDERMLPSDIEKLRRLFTINLDVDVIALPRCHYQNWEMTQVEYGSMDQTGPNWQQAIKIHPDWQNRLVRRTMINGQSKVRFQRRVHELMSEESKLRIFRSLNNPVIRHFGWMKTPERKQQIVDLCTKLWNKDCQGEELDQTYDEACHRHWWHPWNFDEHFSPPTIDTTEINLPERPAGGV
jgi:glycosyltransferase involved in cell wall biosynthesis